MAKFCGCEERNIASLEVRIKKPFEVHSVGDRQLHPKYRTGACPQPWAFLLCRSLYGFHMAAGCAHTWRIV